ncbi:hypothetical protein [Aestuariibacter salexigens]|uniref:hypothetical protein n=1 Tax=Aestuariibacter salexigens TaxID=226010 RepID=UPI00047E7145|nr:hypothetical protein [Aestuariibacter salexigens]
MYDFNFGSQEDIRRSPEEFLIFVKRLLPRWANGIPDSECVAIFRALEPYRDSGSSLVETGSGASSLALFLHCALYGGTMYSWDTNASKGAYLRSVASDAIGRVLGVDVHKIWRFVAFDSTNPHVGLPVMRELNITPVFGFFDSWHTLEHLTLEISQFTEICASRATIAIDDAYYTKRYENYSYINMLRAKLGLGSVQEPVDNVCQPYYVEIENLLKSTFSRVEKIEDSYKQDFQSDLFFEYFESDRYFMNQLGMEQKNALAHRFDAWRVS